MRLLSYQICLFLISMFWFYSVWNAEKQLLMAARSHSLSRSPTVLHLETWLLSVSNTCELFSLYSSRQSAQLKGSNKRGPYPPWPNSTFRLWATRKRGICVNIYLIKNICTSWQSKLCFPYFLSQWSTMSRLRILQRAYIHTTTLTYVNETSAVQMVNINLPDYFHQILPHSWPQATTNAPINWPSGPAAVFMVYSFFWLVLAKANLSVGVWRTHDQYFNSFYYVTIPGRKNLLLMSDACLEKSACILTNDRSIRCTSHKLIATCINAHTHTHTHKEVHIHTCNAMHVCPPCCPCKTRLHVEMSTETMPGSVSLARQRWAGNVGLMLRCNVALGAKWLCVSSIVGGQMMTLNYEYKINEYSKRKMHMLWIRISCRNFSLGRAATIDFSCMDSETTHDTCLAFVFKF